MESKIDIDINELQEMAASGKYSTKALARHFCVTPGTVYNRLKELNIENAYIDDRLPRRCKVPAEDILALRKKGMSWEAIGRHYGHSSSTIVMVLRRAGKFETKKRVNKADQVKDEDITEMLAVAERYERRLQAKQRIKEFRERNKTLSR